MQQKKEKKNTATNVFFEVELNVILVIVPNLLNMSKRLKNILFLVINA